MHACMRAGNRTGWQICTVCGGRIHLPGCTTHRDADRDCCEARHLRLAASGETHGRVDASIPMLGTQVPLRRTHAARVSTARRKGTNMDIRISICPTNMEVGSEGDLLDEEAYLSAIRDAVESRWPDATISCLQVGYWQGDEWFALDGQRSDEVREIVEGIDTSDETLYAVVEDE